MTRQVPDEQSGAVRAEAQRFLASRPDLSAADIAQHTPLAESTVRNFLKGSCPGGRVVTAEVRRAVDLARAGEILRPGDGRVMVVAAESPARVRRVKKLAQFYETQTAQKVCEVLDYCAEHAAIGVITADFGAGKTEAVNAWRGRDRGVESLLFEFDEFSSTNKVDFVRSLAEMLGVDAPPGSQTGGKVFRAVCRRLQDAPCLLIFDQCETVRVRICQVIRQIWDHTREYGVGVVMLAAPILVLRMLGSRMADLGALTSRVGVWAALTGVTKPEMAAIVKQEGILEVEEAAFDLWWRAAGGSMRRVMAAVELIKARHAGKRVTEKTIAGVAGHLWGMRLEA
jgi:DNA transposition AAA+ family ATPase